MNTEQNNQSLIERFPIHCLVEQKGGTGYVVGHDEDVDKVRVKWNRGRGEGKRLTWEPSTKVKRLKK